MSFRVVDFFCEFSDRDFMTASTPQTSFSFSEKEKEGKRKTAQGVPPRSEPRFAPADRDEIKSRGSMRLRPPRPPGERARRERQLTEMGYTAEKVSVFGAKSVSSAIRAARFLFGFPSRAAKQGRGIELVPSGNQDPRLPEPQRDSCQVVPLAELRLIEV